MPKFNSLNREYFESRSVVDPDTGCWNWKLFHDRHGRARMSLTDDNGETTAYAGNVSYRVAFGKVPIGLMVSSSCRNKSCVNPDHMSAMSHKEVMRKAAAAKEKCPKGHPYDKENTYVSKEGYRQCKTCGKARVAERRANGRRNKQSTDTIGPGSVAKILGIDIVTLNKLDIKFSRTDKFHPRRFVIEDVIEYAKRQNLTVDWSALLEIISPRGQQ